MLCARGIPLTEFAAQLRGADEVPELHVGDMVSVRVEVTKRAGQVWRSTGLRRVTLSYQWREPDGRTTVVADGLRTELPDDMGPGESRGVSVPVAAPIAAGRFLLIITPVQESVAWFYDRGTQPLCREVVIEP